MQAAQQTSDLTHLYDEDGNQINIPLIDLNALQWIAHIDSIYEKHELAVGCLYSITLRVRRVCSDRND